MNTVICAASDPLWDSLLEALPHDMYQSGRYHAFESENGEGEAWAYAAEEGEQRFFWPYLRKPVVIPEAGSVPGLFEVRSCYGYPGPVCSEQASPAFLHQAVGRLLEMWREEGVVNAFTRLHPVLANNRILEAAELGDTASLVCHGKTVSIDLTLDTQARMSRYNASLRNGVRRNQRNGLKTVLDPSFAYFEDFCRNYRATMDRNQAASYYYFDAAYFRRLIEHNPGVVHLFVTHTAAGEAACTALYSEYRGQLQSLFIMNNPEFFSLAPSRTLIDDVSEWGRLRGNLDHHLGGGRGGASDSLFEFKASFSGLLRDFYTQRLIVDPEQYARLTRMRAEICQLEDAEDHFFPAWRKPVPQAALAAFA